MRTRKIRVVHSPPSVLDGVVSAFDLFGIYAPKQIVSDRPAETDADALASDWQQVGDGLRDAMGRYPIETAIEEARAGSDGG